MKIGAVFPQNGVGADPGAVRAFAQGVEDAGFDHIVGYDHVLNASASVYPYDALKGPYRERDVFNEPLMLFAFLSGLTKRLSFATGILILTQRQTALVAKQAAYLDVLCGGRLRLGIGTGWNWVEYEALGVPWAQRGIRVEEQIEVMRALWTQPIVNFKGRLHSIAHAGINPMPVQRPIPIWFGGVSEPVIKRAARMGDGWMPVFKGMEAGSRSSQKAVDPRITFEQFHNEVRSAGRDPAQVGIECRITYEGTPDDWNRQYNLYRSLGASHITLVTVHNTLAGVDANLDAMRRMKAALS